MRVKDGYVDDSGHDVRAGYGGEVIEIDGDVADVRFVGLQSGAEFTGADPIPVRLDWLEIVE